jgi:hypothetical protein
MIPCERFQLAAGSVKTQVGIPFVSRHAGRSPVLHALGSIEIVRRFGLSTVAQRPPRLPLCRRHPSDISHCGFAIEQQVRN